MRRRIRVKSPKEEITWLDKAIKESKKLGDNYDERAEYKRLFSRKPKKKTKEQEEMEYISKIAWGSR
jgi:hypothetical protein